jgi:hypothetical protein
MSNPKVPPISPRSHDARRVHRLACLWPGQVRLGAALIGYLALAGACVLRPRMYVKASEKDHGGLLAIQVGDSVRLQAGREPSDPNACGREAAAWSFTEPDRFAWETSSPTAGEVRRDGMFVARAAGFTAVGVRSGDAYAAVTMAVVPRVGAERFGVRAATAQVGDTLNLPFTLTDTAGAPLSGVVDVEVQPRDSTVLRVLGTFVQSGGRVVRVVARAAGSTWLVASADIVPRIRPPGDSIPAVVVPRP